MIQAHAACDRHTLTAPRASWSVRLPQSLWGADRVLGAPACRAHPRTSQSLLRGGAEPGVPARNTFATRSLTLRSLNGLIT